MSGEEGSTWAFVAQTGIIVVGWVIVHKLSARRDRDKARRELTVAACDSLDSAVNSLLLDAIAYHEESRDVAKERALKMALQDLALQVSELPMVCWDRSHLSECKSSIGNLRRAITGHHFEDEHLISLPAEAQQFQDMADAALELKRRIAKLKFYQFPP